MSKQLIVLLVLAAIVMTATGCGAAPTATAVPAPPATATTAAPAAPTAATVAAAFPVTLTDAAGRKVTVKAQPQRIVSLAPANTEALFAVGAGAQVVGDTTYCNYPPEAAAVAKIGGYSADTISIEKIVALKPDLVLAESGTHDKVIAALDPLGITAIAVNPHTIEDVYSDLAMLGRITGQTEKASAIVSTMQKRIRAVSDKTATIPQDKRVTVFWEVWDEPLMTAGPGTFTGQLVELAGGINVFKDVKQDYPQINAEDVVKASPAAIMGPDTHSDKLTASLIARRPGWEQIAAVKTGRVYLVNGDTSSRPGPRLADALEEIARDLYPDLFK
jgi:iron complex transport system substrate-binding protein